MRYTSLVKPPHSNILKAGKVTLSPGESVGEHVTEKKEEIIIALQGTGFLQKEDEEIPLRVGEACFVPEGTRHNVHNRSDSVLEYIYVVGLLEKTEAHHH